MRSYNRFATDEEINVVIEGERDVATLYNLSSGGCMLETRNTGASNGSTVEIDLRGMVQAQGHVVWRVDQHCGVKFTTPVHQKIVTMLGYTYLGEDFDAEDPRDRFGLPLFGS